MYVPNMLTNYKLQIVLKNVTTITDSQILPSVHLLDQTKIC